MLKTVLLVGSVGTGKTTLFNKITNSNQQCCAGGQICTIQAFVKQSEYGERFQLIDTPGFGSCSDSFYVRAGFLSAINKFLINRIMVVIKFERLDIIRRNLKEFIKLFEKYKDKITVVITHMDYAQDEYQKSIHEIQKMVNNENINSVIFASRQNSSQELCQLFYFEIKDSEAQKISLTEDQQLSLLDQIDLDFELEDSVQEFIINPFRTLMKQKKKLDEDIIKQIIKKGFLNCQQFMQDKEEWEKFQIYFYLKKMIKESFYNVDFENFLEKELKSYEVGRKESLEKLYKYKQDVIQL